jgi:hypothetical protein
MSHSRHRLSAVIALLLSAACQTAAPAVVSGEAGQATPPAAHSAAEPPRQAAAETPEPLTELNGLFHQLYAGTRDAYISRLGTEERPVLLMSGTLTLHWKGQATKYPVLGPRYHALKSISHTVLATYVALLGGSGSPLSEETKGRLQRLREIIPAVQGALEDPRSSVRAAIPTELVGEQYTLLREAEALLAEALTQDRPSAERLARFAQAVRPAIVTNARAAARDEVDQLHQQVTAIRGLLGPEAWKRVVVVISTARQARSREVSLQYFERVLGEPVAGEGASRESRIVVLEAFGSRKPLEVMGIHELDQDIAAGLLGDRFLLQSDLLGPYAAEYLRQLPLE